MLVRASRSTRRSIAHRRALPRQRPRGAPPPPSTAQRVLCAARREARGGGALRGNRQPRGGVPAAAARGAAEESRARWRRLASAQFARPFQRGRGARFDSERHAGLGAAARAIVEKGGPAPALAASGKVAEARTHLEAALALEREGAGARCEAHVLAKLAICHTRVMDTARRPCVHAQAWPSLASLAPRPGVQGAQLPGREYHLGRSKNPGRIGGCAHTCREIGDRRWRRLLGNWRPDFSEGKARRGARPSRGGAGRGARAGGSDIRSQRALATWPSLPAAGKDEEAGRS